MRRITVLLAIAGLFGHASAQSPGFKLEGIGSATVPVTMAKMTNLVFPEAVQTGVKISREVSAQKVRGVENVIELRALRRNFTPTNLTVYGKDGRLFSFVLRYVEDTAVLNFRVVAAGAVVAGGNRETPASASEYEPVMLSGLPVDLQRLRADALLLAGRPARLHVTARSEGWRLRLTGVYFRDSLEWLSLALSNASPMPFAVAKVRFFLQDRKEVRRRAMQDIDLEPVYSAAPPAVGGGKETKFAAGFWPFQVGRSKRLVVEVVGADGRVMRLKLSFRSQALHRIRQRRLYALEEDGCQGNEQRYCPRGPKHPPA